MISIVTAKGQITIPATIRSSLHIKPNDKMDFIVDNGRIIVIPVKALKELRGSVPIDEHADDFTSERQLAKDTMAKMIS